MTTRYCGLGGNDGNSGLTWALRKLTLNGVEDTPVVAGDVCYIAPGVYREQLTADVSGGNTYQIATVDVTKGSKQVDGNGTAWVVNVAADYMFHIAIYASGNDGVANGTATFTSAGGNFQANMIGKPIQIMARGAYVIGAVAAVNSITLTDPNGLGWPGAGVGLTYSVASGKGHYDIDSVDDNTTIQLKQPWNGPTLTAINYITFNPIRYIGDVTGEHTDQVGGIVRITGSDDDQTETRAHGIFSDGKDYRTFRGFFCDTTTSSLITIDDGAHCVIEDCPLEGSTHGAAEGKIVISGVDQSCNTLRRCWILGGDGVGIKFIHTVQVNNAGHLVENCFVQGLRSDGIALSRIFGVTIRNTDILNNGDDGIDSIVAGTGDETAIVAENCVVAYNGGNGFEAAQVGDIVEDFNNVIGNKVARSNVNVGANSQAYPTLFLPPILHAGASQISGFKFPWQFGSLSEWSAIRAITGSNEPAEDLHGIARPVTVAKNSWGALQFADMERETGTTHAGAASLCLHDAGRHQIWVPVANESTTISVYVYREANYAGNNPQMIIKQPGQADDITTDAAAASQWNLLTTTLTPAADPPYVVVELVSRNTAAALAYETFFDDLVVN